MSTHRAAAPRYRGSVGAAGSALALVWLVAPVVPLLLWAVADRWQFPSPLPQDWGPTGWRASIDQGVLPAAARSTGLGAAVAAVATPAGALAGWALARTGLRENRAVSLALLAPIALPPFAVVTGLSTVALRTGVPPAVSVLLVLIVAALPYTTYVMRSAYAGYDARYEDAARSLGASRGDVLTRVHLPLVAPALAAAALLAFLVAWSDYVVTLLLGAGSLVSLPLLVGALASASGNDSTVAAASVAAVLPPIVLLVLSGAIARRTGRR